MRAVARLGATVEEVLKENVALDLYASFFDNNDDVLDVQPPSLLPVTLLSDPHAGCTPRSALCIHFQVCPQAARFSPPGIDVAQGNAERLAVACGPQHRAMDGGRQSAAGDGECIPASGCVWDLQQPTVPCHTLHARFTLGCLAFSPKVHSILATMCLPFTVFV